MPPTRDNWRGHHAASRLIKASAVWTAVSYSRIFGANDRIRIAGLGVGGRATYLLSLASKAENTEIAAVCDIYEPRRLAAKEKFAPAGKAYVDYREALERSDIDAVIIGSPDHWHVPMTIDAARAGKGVYVEKPISHTIEEGEPAHDAERRSIQGRLEAIPRIRSRSAVRFLALYAVALVLGLRRRTPDRPVFAYGDVVHWFMDQDSLRTAQASGNRSAIPDFECPDTINAAWVHDRLQWRAERLARRREHRHRRPSRNDEAESRRIRRLP